MAKSKASVKINSEAGTWYNEKSPGERYNDVMEDLRNVYPVFLDSYARAQRNVDFYMGRQWSNNELRAFHRQMRPPYVFNRIFPIVNNLLGAQQQTKMDVKALPVEIGDDYAVMMTNKIIKWMEQINNIDYIEQEIFKHGILEGFSVTQVRWQHSDFVDGMPLIERIPMNQIMWDASSQQPDLSDARWIARIIPMQKPDAITEFPEYAELVESASWGVSDTYYMLRDAINRNTFMQEYGYGYDIEERGIVWVVEHYEKVPEYEYVVVDNAIGTSIKSFDSERDANKYMEGLIDQATENARDLKDEFGNDMIFCVTLKRNTYLQSIVLGSECVSFTKTDLPETTYQVYIPISVNGEFTSPIDSLISSQRFTNRMISEWDNQMMRTNKAAMTVIQGMLDQGWSVEDVAQQRGRSGVVIPVRDHGAIQMLPNQPASSDFPNLLNVAQSYMMEAAGGANILGLQENAAESSKTVRARQAAAGLARLPLFKSLEQWRKKVTEMAVWQCKQYLTPGQQLRIIGDDKDVEFVAFEENELDTIREARTDFLIESTVDSAIARESTIDSLREFFQSMQGAIPGDVAASILLELDPNIPKETKERVLGMIKSYGEFRQKEEEAASQQKIQSQAERSVQGQALRDQIREQMSKTDPGLADGLQGRAK